jgi:hypothetical protein
VIHYVNESAQTDSRIAFYSLESQRNHAPMLERLAICFIGSIIATALALTVAQGFSAAVNAPFKAQAAIAETE